jgi:predicted RNase H-like nuclease
MTTTIIGIDCATRDKRVGLALGAFDDGAAQIEQVLVGSMLDSVIDTVADWTTRAPSTLIAPDAPLGWPADLGRALHAHEAGAPVYQEPNLLFRRETDRVVKASIGKQPLDVGADRMARTAHAALRFLEELRQQTGEAIPLAWVPTIGPGVHAIEVYPGATFAAYGVDTVGYKKKDGHAARRRLVAFLRENLRVLGDPNLMAANDDALDAAVCVLAGVDFLRGRAAASTNLDAAKKEGWIWVRKPDRSLRRRPGHGASGPLGRGMTTACPR